MKLTELQYASLVISLSTLGQTDLSENGPKELVTLEYLLEEAHANVKRARGAQDSSTGQLADERDRAFEFPQRDYDL